MENKEIVDVLRFFSRARSEYDRRGMKRLALQCDEAIALAQHAALLGFTDEQELSTTK
jgi:hypothetical protein